MPSKKRQGATISPGGKTRGVNLDDDQSNSYAGPSSDTVYNTIINFLSNFDDEPREKVSEENTMEWFIRQLSEHYIKQPKIVIDALIKADKEATISGSFLLTRELNRIVCGINKNTKEYSNDILNIISNLAQENPQELSAALKKATPYDKYEKKYRVDGVWFLVRALLTDNKSLEVNKINSTIVKLYEASHKDVISIIMQRVRCESLSSFAINSTDSFINKFEKVDKIINKSKPENIANEMPLLIDFIISASQEKFKGSIEEVLEDFSKKEPENFSKEFSDFYQYIPSTIIQDMNASNTYRDVDTNCMCLMNYIETVVKLFGKKSDINIDGLLEKNVDGKSSIEILAMYLIYKYDLNNQENIEIRKNICVIIAKLLDEKPQETHDALGETARMTLIGRILRSDNNELFNKSSSEIIIKLFKYSPENFNKLIGTDQEETIHNCLKEYNKVMESIRKRYDGPLKLSDIKDRIKELHSVIDDMSEHSEALYAQNRYEDTKLFMVLNIKLNFLVNGFVGDYLSGNPEQNKDILERFVKNCKDTINETKPYLDIHQSSLITRFVKVLLKLLGNLLIVPALINGGFFKLSNATESQELANKFEEMLNSKEF